MELYGFVRLHAREGKESAVEEALRDVTGHSRDEAGCTRCGFSEPVDELLDQPREVAKTEMIG